MRSQPHELHEDARAETRHTPCCTSGMPSDDDADPVAEISNLARQVTRLRRQILLLDGAIVAACILMLARQLHGAVDRSRFFLYWLVVFFVSLLSLAISSRMWSEIGYLRARSRWLGSRNRR